MADPFKDETQKAIAHTQLLRSYLQDLDSLQRNTSRGQESNQAVARSPTIDNQQQRDKTVAETPDQPVKLQTPTKPQKKNAKDTGVQQPHNTLQHLALSHFSLSFLHQQLAWAKPTGLLKTGVVMLGRQMSGTLLRHRDGRRCQIDATE